MLGKSLIQFSVDGQCCVPSLFFDLRSNYGGVNAYNGNLLQKVPWTHCHTQCPQTLQQATTNPCLCQRLLDTHRQVWVSLLWGHCSFLLGPGAHKVLFVPSKSLFPQSCVSSGGSMAGLMVTSSIGLMPYPGQLHPEPLSLCRPLLTCTSAGDTLTLKGRACSVSLRSPSAHKLLFEPSKCLCWGWGLILIAI